MGKSSKDKRDIYYRLAKEEGWRARSAFKLIQIHENFDLLNSNVKKAVDLCAAPGSWSQVLSKHNIETIIAVDLQLIAPLEGVVQIQGDITKDETSETILKYFGGKHADLVLCDGAPDVTGLHEYDEFVQMELLNSSLNICTKILSIGGSFVVKLFRGENLSSIYKLFAVHFETTTCFKPRASRNSSTESYLVCQNFGTMATNYIPNFRASSSISFDSDKHYHQFDDNYKTPICLPSIPPYKESLKLVRSGIIKS